MTDMEIMLESYLFPDGKSKLKYAALTEAEKKVFTKDMVTKLFNTIKNKSLKVNYMGLEKTKGDFTKYPKYEDVANSIKILNNMYNSNSSDAPKEILSCVRTLELLKKYKNDFVKSFNDKNEPAAILYVNICAALIAGTSKIVAATIEYIKQPTGEYKAAFKKESQNALKDDVYFESLSRFITMDKNGQLKQVFDISGSTLNENLMLDEGLIDNIGEVKKVVDAINGSKFGKTTKTVIKVTIVLIGVVFVVNTLPYQYYRLKKSISDHLLNLAYFLEEHAYELETDTKHGREVQERQLRIVEKLKSLGNSLSLEDKKAQKEAEKDKKKDEEESRKENDSSTSYDDDDVLL